MAGFEKLRPESEADVYRRRYKKRRSIFEGLRERIQGLREGPRPMPKWRPMRPHEEEHG